MVDKLDKLLIQYAAEENAPSTLALVGRYILTSRIFYHLARAQAGAGVKLLTYRFNGTRYDCGSKLGYLKAQTAFGLKHEDLREEFAAYLATLK